MIIIDDVLIHSDVVIEEFACNLKACEGACCWEGDFGAPLESKEIDILDRELGSIKTYLPEENRNFIDSEGFHKEYPEKNIIGTTLLPNGACIFLTFENGIAKCGIQKAFESQQATIPKPVSCHLYPIRIKKDPNTQFELVNYDRWDICSAACKKGKELKIPVFQFVKEALIRKFGEEFYVRLEDSAAHFESE